MIDARDLWAALATGSPTARVTVRTASGDEVDVSSVQCYGQLVVIRTDDPVHTADETCSEKLGEDGIPPEQITALLDAHSADIGVMTALLEELEGRSFTTVEELRAALDLAESLDDLDDQDVLT